MKQDSSAEGLELVDFASTRTIYDPENSEAWITMAWDYDKLAEKKNRQYE